MRLSRLPSEHDVDPREIEDRSFQFAASVARLAKDAAGQLPEDIVHHLVEEGTSVGAQVSEAHGTTSRRNYLTKMTVARHASQRVQYWLKLVGALHTDSAQAVQDLLEDAQALQTTINALCLKARQTLEGERRE